MTQRPASLAPRIRLALGLLLAAAGIILLFTSNGIPGAIMSLFRPEFLSQLADSLPATGLGLLRQSLNLAFSPGAIVAALGHLLLSCWPLALVGAGVLLLRSISQTGRGEPKRISAGYSDREVRS